MLNLSIKAQRTLVLGMIFFVSSETVFGIPSHSEREYLNVWCQRARGTPEVRLADRTRVDCLTAKYAVEMDFSPKWKEAIGQAFHYSLITGKEPGIVLILEQPEHRKYWDQLNRVLHRYELSIRTWIITPADLSLPGRRVRPPSPAAPPAGQRADPMRREAAIP
ncbi:MAG: hypothetical protein ACE5ER_00730 [Nitrospinaceae bacterium]